VRACAQWPNNLEAVQQKAPEGSGASTTAVVEGDGMDAQGGVGVDGASQKMAT